MRGEAVATRADDAACADAARTDDGASAKFIKMIAIKTAVKAQAHEKAYAHENARERKETRNHPERDLLLLIIDII